MRRTWTLLLLLLLLPGAGFAAPQSHPPMRALPAHRTGLDEPGLHGSFGSVVKDTMTATLLWVAYHALKKAESRERYMRRGAVEAAQAFADSTTSFNYSVNFNVKFDCFAWESAAIHCNRDRYFEHQCYLERQRCRRRQLHGRNDQQRWTLYCPERPTCKFQCDYCRCQPSGPDKAGECHRDHIE